MSHLLLIHHPGSITQALSTQKAFQPSTTLQIKSEHSFESLVLLLQCKVFIPQSTHNLQVHSFITTLHHTGAACYLQADLLHGLQVNLLEDALRQALPSFSCALQILIPKEGQFSPCTH